MIGLTSVEYLSALELDKYFNDIAVVLGSLTGCSDELKQPNARGISTHENLPIARENAKKGDREKNNNT